MNRKWLAACVLISSAIAYGAQLTPEERKENDESFEYIWKTIHDKYWDPSIGGLDWQGVHDELKPKLEKARTMSEARAVMEEMLGRLHLTHFEIIPEGGHGNSEDGPEPAGDGETGLDVRVIDHQALVTHVEPGSAAEHEGIRTGWQIIRSGGKPLASAIAKIEKAYNGSSLRGLMLRSIVLDRLRGYPEDTLEVEFRDEENKPVARKLKLDPPKGVRSKFGFLPASYVWMDTQRRPTQKRNGAVYIHWNLFLDPAHLMPKFADAVQSCESCPGLILDLRGNPGGIGAMAMGMAGWFVDRPGERLGTLYLRDSTLNFVITPRPDVYTGPLAILVDESSASTSEILAGGLKDLKRARIFGTRTAAAALPSAIEMLPNGDGFQYAMANYISEGGKPLEGLGVTPDTETPVTRQDLLNGKDAALDAALQWIESQNSTSRKTP